MATEPERSKPLHNFSLPCLKWGNQRFLRCVKTPFHDSKRKSNTHRFNTSVDNDNNNIDAVREKLTTDLRVAAKKLKVSILEEGGGGGGNDNNNNNAGPWNLRTRRAACKAPHEEEGKCDLGSSPMKKKEGEEAVAAASKTKFSITLPKKDVEQDFLAMLGTKPPRRPKKRPRVVQRKLDTLFPGLWLTEVNAESYKVSDIPE
ncbi:DUF1639 family protein [Senna tora]|uniref:DUF1639 family protein n=1 Tax=Senna tora TaxID=362788 RepID=A0A834WE35_9FABA|nr:DUF1639 family protein [Senna tora]